MNNMTEKREEITEEIKTIISGIEEIKASFDIFGALVEKAIKA